MKKLRDRLALGLLAWGSLVGCSKRDQTLAPKLYAALQPVRALTHGYAVIDLPRLTDFPWDSVYFFQGETGDEYMMEVTGIRWSMGEVPNHYTRLVFVHQGQIIRYADLWQEETNELMSQLPLPIWMGIYPCDGRRPVCPRNKARFASFPTCESGNVYYTLIPLACLDNFKDELATACYQSSTHPTQEPASQDSVQR